MSTTLGESKRERESERERKRESQTTLIVIEKENIKNTTKWKDR